MTQPALPAVRPRAFPDFPPLAAGWMEEARRVRAGRFRLIGEEYDLGPDVSWQVNPSRDKEWQIAQHKFVFGPALVRATTETGDPGYLDTWVRLVRSWLTEMGSGAITLSDAQVEAKRLEHWVWSVSLLKDTHWLETVPTDLLAALTQRIGEEARYILGHLKPVRNHRTFELYAVALAATCFPEVDPDGKLGARAAELLQDNLLTDLLPDGVQCELSSHYHQLVAETAVGFVELCRRNGIPVPAELETRVHAALVFSSWLQWPDGDLPLVNDADNGRHQDLLRRGAALYDDDELAFAATLGADGRPPARASRRFPSSGYVVLRDGWGTDAVSHAASQHVLYDCALLGDGSHSHYDLFSFTYFADGGPAVVDPGRYTYSSEPDAAGVDWRHHFKSTLAHNTVTVDGRDQTRYLSRTKHGPDVGLEDPAWSAGLDDDPATDPGTDWVTARARSHEYTPTHRRTLLFPGRGYLLLVDELDGVDALEHTYRARFHLPDLVADLSGRPGHAELRASRCQIRCASPDPVQAQVEQDWVSTAYGVKEPAAVLDVAVTGAGRRTLVSLVQPGSAPPLGLRVTATGRGLVAHVDHPAGGDALDGTDVLLLGNADEPVRDGATAMTGHLALVRLDRSGRPTSACGHRVERLELPGGAVLAGERLQWHA